MKRSVFSDGKTIANAQKKAAWHLLLRSNGRSDREQSFDDAHANDRHCVVSGHSLLAQMVIQARPAPLKF
jgi:hypothetical protein